jgi:CopG-like RHH_1 or ribbon-helix-helix domain, RHH_5
MLYRSAKTATYDQAVAKIEITLPDDLLERIDRAAEEDGVPRDELLLRFIEDGATRNKAAFRQKIEDMLGPPIPLGDSAQLIREMRDQRLPPSMRSDPEADDD